LIDPGAKTMKQIALEWPAAIAVSERHQLDF
jgi:hypothetical protein